MISCWRRMGIGCRNWLGRGCLLWKLIRSKLGWLWSRLLSESLFFSLDISYLHWWIIFFSFFLESRRNRMLPIDHWSPRIWETSTRKLSTPKQVETCVQLNKANNVRRLWTFNCRLVFMQLQYMLYFTVKIHEKKKPVKPRLRPMPSPPDLPWAIEAEPGRNIPSPSEVEDSRTGPHPI